MILGQGLILHFGFLIIHQRHLNWFSSKENFIKLGIALIQVDQGHWSHCIQHQQRKYKFELNHIDQTKVLNSSDEQ